VSGLGDERHHAAVDIPTWEGGHQVVWGVDVGVGEGLEPGRGHAREIGELQTDIL
jgi:hypothetical protein